MSLQTRLVGPPNLGEIEQILGAGAAAGPPGFHEPEKPAMRLQDLLQEIPLVEKHLDDAAQNEIAKTAECSDQEAHHRRGIEGSWFPCGNRRDELTHERKPRHEAEQREHDDV